MVVEWSTSPDFTAPRRRSTARSRRRKATSSARSPSRACPVETRIYYRVRFEAERASEWIDGALSTPDALDDTAHASSPSDVVFAWSGDTNGQGWGIDPARGGMPAFTALLDRAPDFFVSVRRRDLRRQPDPRREAARRRHRRGRTSSRRRRTTSPRHSTTSAARISTLASSPQVRALSANVPSFSIWDDHEVRNNWFPGEVIVDAARRRAPHERRRGRARAMLEHSPTLVDPSRHVSLGALGPDARGLLPRRPQLPHAEPSRAPRSRRSSAQTQLAWLEARARRVDRDVEGGRLRHADRPRRVRARAGRSGVDAFDGFANTNGRRRVASWSSRSSSRTPAARGAKRRVAHGRRPLRGGASLQSVARRVQGHDSVLGVRRRADARDVVSAEALRRHVRPRARVRVRELGHVRLTRDGRAVLRRRSHRRPKPAR